MGRCPPPESEVSGNDIFWQSHVNPVGQPQVVSLKDQPQGNGAGHDPCKLGSKALQQRSPLQGKDCGVSPEDITRPSCWSEVGRNRLHTGKHQQLASQQDCGPGIAVSGKRIPTIGRVIAEKDQEDRDGKKEDSNDCHLESNWADAEFDFRPCRSFSKIYTETAIGTTPLAFARCKSNGLGKRMQETAILVSPWRVLLICLFI